MSNKGYQIHTSVTKYPGNDRYYVLCDVCGKKYRKCETVQVQDRFNLQNRLLVCHRDLDMVNEQSRPFKAREYKAPKLTRPEPAQYPTIPNLNSDKAPGMPLNLVAQGDPIYNYVDLFWQGPIDGGSDPITGYVIYRASPQLAFPEVLCVNTLTGVPYYQDSVSTFTDFATYWVAAINAFGTGPLSDPVYWPFINTDTTEVYLEESQIPNDVLTTGDGRYIILSE